MNSHAVGFSPRFDHGFGRRAAASPAAGLRSQVARFDPPRSSDIGSTLRSQSLQPVVRAALEAARAGRVDADRIGARPVEVAAPSRLDASRVSRSSETRFELQLTTAEGDAVTIRLRSEAFSSRESLRATAGGDRLAYDSRTRGSELDLQIEVEGDLSRRELRQIRGLVKDVLRTGEKALDGDLGAFERLADRGVRKSEIASFALDYKRTETLAASTYSQIGGPLPDPFSVTPAPQPARLSSTPSSASLPDSVVATLDRLASEARSLIEQARETVRPAEAPSLVRGLLDRAIDAGLTPA